MLFGRLNQLKEHSGVTFQFSPQIPGPHDSAITCHLSGYSCHISVLMCLQLLPGSEAVLTVLGIQLLGTVVPSKALGAWAWTISMSLRAQPGCVPLSADE